jgi:LytS/YehU family sensor histidine kinase
VGIIGAFALQLRRERREARQARLTAARLEIELLKKSVQPHFLMNTLTALAQTVEENPARAVKLIEDLADEFRRLAAMAGEKQIPLARELDLCRAHLGVMRARTDVEWKLDAEGVDETAAVPPALFLTLIENGFSHQRARKGANTFTLRAAAGPNGVRYTFRSPGTITATPGRAEGGTGLRYVRARLEESFPGAWQLLQSAVPDGWETVIELTATAPTRAPT